ncbi:purine nucleoside phosphorylase [Halobacteriovorax marinus SJ]|uniref:Purine nucleoside phosphorylase n=1 Tax=Halobacteriovorax marinus (strain ATCC BAA-682 / DSM 15412 / SJ) TaxID=862908 RepID=E1WXI0_HALMS|nr:purine-nucleoside phosphorylase [Halobacteriovorax marinus]CBW27497.1 purine nucleoside phosphorylase [Halobacteriovorax marinus SJ]
MYEKLATAAAHIQKVKPCSPKVGVVLGSGLGDFVDQIEDKTIISYDDIPFFHKTTVEGHAGKLILGKIGNTEIAALQGRFHSYEGLEMDDVVFPTRLLSTLGVDTLILTNAAGGINTNYQAGDLVVIEDHINMTGNNPLVGPNIKEMGPRFPDMSKAYHPELREIILKSAEKLGYTMQTGIYAGVLGPTYETPAEVRMLRTLGADVVGMSTVPECIAANHIGMKVCGISCVTNMASGIENVELKHEDIKDEALRVMEKFTSILKETVKTIGA